MTANLIRTWAGSTPWQYLASGKGPRGLLVLGEPPIRVHEQFGETRRVLAPSFPPVESVLQMTDGLVQLLDREKLDRVDVLGHQVGAGIAHAFVRRHPERVDRVALSGFGLYSKANALRVRWLWAWSRWLPAFALRRLDFVELRLLAELFKNRRAYRVDESQALPGRVLVLLDEDESAFTRDEQHALIGSYPGSIACLSSGRHLERKLDFFFRSESRPAALPRMTCSA